MKTSPLIYSTNQWSGFYIITASVIKELIVNFKKLTETAILVSCEI